jgi:hypothetical protein
MRVRFEVDIERPAASLAAGGFEGEDFGVFHSGVRVGSGARDVSQRVKDYRSYIWIR